MAGRVPCHRLPIPTQVREAAVSLGTASPQSPRVIGTRRVQEDTGLGHPLFLPVPVDAGELWTFLHAPCPPTDGDMCTGPSELAAILSRDQVHPQTCRQPPSDDSCQEAVGCEGTVSTWEGPRLLLKAEQTGNLERGRLVKVGGGPKAAGCGEEGGAADLTGTWVPTPPPNGLQAARPSSRPLRFRQHRDGAPGTGLGGQGSVSAVLRDGISAHTHPCFKFLETSFRGLARAPLSPYFYPDYPG